MADRWRDEDRFEQGYRSGSMSEDRRDLGRPRSDYSDYDRDPGGRDDRERAGRYDRDDRTAYSNWGQSDSGREPDRYTRAASPRGAYDRSRSMQRAERYGAGDGNESRYGYGARNDDRMTGGYGESRAYGSPGGFGYGAYDARNLERARIDGLRGFRDRGYDFDDERDGGDQHRSYGAYGRSEERGWMERAGDEVRSWFGDEDAERRRRMDQYRGHGPKGYTRSDERIREDVNDRLSDDSRVDATEIEVKVSGGEVTLSGTVRDRLQKRRAEDIAEDISGVRHVQNNLRVQTALNAGNSATGTAATSLSPGAATPPNINPTTGDLKQKS